VRNTSHVVTFTGSGFQASPAPTVQLGSVALGSVSVISPTQLTATVPSGIGAGVYTATVTNFDTQIGMLANAYTATNPAVGPRTFLLSPSTQRVGDDETSTTVDVQIQDVSDLAAFEFEVTYNPDVVHVDDVTLGAFLGSGGRNTAALGPDIDNTAGRVTFGGFSYGTGSGADGSGTVATITFSPQMTGTTSLTLTNVQLRDTFNSEIPADPQGGEIEVVHYPFGDFDRDCDVDITDIMVVASRWNDPANYDAAYDFDSDGDIDVADIMQVASVWGDTCGGGMGMGCMATTAYSPQEGADVLFSPPEMAVQVGVPFTMDIAITQATDLGGFEFDLLFDSDVVTVTAVHLGSFLESSGNNAGELGPRYAESGRLVFGAFSYGEHEGASGYGTLATLELILLSDTETTLRLDDVQLVTSGGEEVSPHSVGEGKVSSGERVYLPLVLRKHQ
jgi:general secretion pathway protein D